MKGIPEDHFLSLLIESGEDILQISFISFLSLHYKIMLSMDILFLDPTGTGFRWISILIYLLDNRHPSE